MKDRCLTDDEITAYVDGVADPSARKRIEEHLAQCGLCLHNVAELKKLISSHETEVTPLPDAALARAEAIIEKYMGSREFDITLAIRNGICRILESTGNLLPPRTLSPVAVRREKRSSTSPRIAKSLSGYLVTVELTPKRDSVKPKLSLVEEISSDRPDGVKAKLYSPGACETKYSRKGTIDFSAIGPGLFRIDIDEIGSVGLEIK